jgi:hypothetical protein
LTSLKCARNRLANTDEGVKSMVLGM